MQGGADGFGGSVGSTADKAVSIARSHHQRGEVKRSPRNGCGLHLRDSLGATALVVERFITREPGAGGGIAGFDENRLQQLFALEARHRSLHSGIVAFGEDDARLRLQLAQALGLGSDEGFSGFWNSHANSS